jgi:hypothetical protein
VFGVNHHPRDHRPHQPDGHGLKLERGEITQAWYEHRVELLAAQFPDDSSDPALHVTSDYTFLGPLRFHVTRTARLRAESWA